MTATPTALSKKSQEAFIEFYKATQMQEDYHRAEQRGRLERVDRIYQRETDRTKTQQDAKTANAAGDATRYQNITVPVVKPQVESATNYQGSVFLTGHPIFGVTADPAYINEALQMDAILEEQSIRGGWVRELNMFFRDNYKYNYAPIEVDWQREVTFSVETNLEVNPDEGVAKEILWAGNTLKRLDPYNTFMDRGVTPSNVYKDGEYAGYTEFMSRIRLKKFIATLPNSVVSNHIAAFNSGTGGPPGGQDIGSMHYYVPDINPAVNVEDRETDGLNWLKWAGLSDTRKQNIEYKDSYEVTTLYARILPAEFNLTVPKSNTPQVYKLIIVNHQWIIYAERQTNAHNWIPILVGQAMEDGLKYQTKSLADDSAPFQEVTSAYMNSIMASRRRAISDRTLFDPSRISSGHINSPNPSAKIPVKPSATGGQISDAVYAFPYREDQQAASVQQISMLLGLSNTLVGQNQATQGQFVKGNKTLHEFETVMQNADSTGQMSSIVLEAQVFTPMKQILKLNIMQYQAGTSVFSRQTQEMVKIDPIQLRKAVVEFKVTDGLVPASKLINSDSYAVAMQVIGSSPEISQQYNLGQLVSYLLKTQGASNISDFEKSPEQVAYEQAMASWQQMVMLAIEKGMNPESVGPMPVPADYGYQPQQQVPGTTPVPSGPSPVASAPAPSQPQAAAEG